MKTPDGWAEREVRVHVWKNRRIPIRAFVRDGLAVHGDVGFGLVTWGVTHIRSGKLVVGGLTRRRAFAAARQLLRTASWDGPERVVLAKNRDAVIAARKKWEEAAVPERPAQ